VWQPGTDPVLIAATPNRLYPDPKEGAPVLRMWDAAPDIVGFRAS